MNLPPRKPKFSIPVSGARVGSLARPVEDGAAKNYGLSKPRFGLRAHASSLQTVADRPSGPISNGSDGEVA